MGDDVAPVTPGAHPRVSGENVIDVQAPESTVGSSPRERGKLAALTAGDRPLRLIPA